MVSAAFVVHRDHGCRAVPATALEIILAIMCINSVNIANAVGFLEQDVRTVI